MEKIRHLFNENQLKMFENINRPILDRDYSDDEILELEDLIAERLMYSGFDDEYNPNDEGRLCESILDVFGDM